MPEIFGGFVYDDEVSDAVSSAHQWTGGYFCSCGLELNSPRGFTRHAVDETLAFIATDIRDEADR